MTRLYESHGYPLHNLCMDTALWEALDCIAHGLQWVAGKPGWSGEWKELEYRKLVECREAQGSDDRYYHHITAKG